MSHMAERLTGSMTAIDRGEVCRSLIGQVEHFVGEPDCILISCSVFCNHTLELIYLGCRETTGCLPQIIESIF